MGYEKLKTLMKEQNVTLVTLSNKLDIDRSTLWRKINMIKNIDFTCTEMISVCLYFDISSDDFFMDL